MNYLIYLIYFKLHRITFFENTFYGAVDQNRSVIQVSKSSTLIRKVLAENLEANPKLVKIFHQQIQPITTASKECDEKNKCEHLCVPLQESSELSLSSSAKIVGRCLCREGFKLENGKCKMRETRKFLMFIQDDPRTLKAVDIDGGDEQIISPIIGLRPYIAFDVDLVNKIIYYTSFSETNSSIENIIEFRTFNGSNRGVLKANFGGIQSMSYDWVGKNLYFTSQLPRTRIAVVKSKVDIKNQNSNPMMKTLIKNIIGPCSLALSPENGKFVLKIDLSSNQCVIF